MAATSPAPVTGRAEVRALDDQLLLPLPAEASAALPSRGQVAAAAVIDGHGFETVIEPDGRRGHWLRIDEELRDDLGLRAGTAVGFSLTPTRDWPEPEVPGDLAAALAEAEDLHGTWGSLTPMARWEWVRWIGSTRSEATRERRVGASVDKLRSGLRRPCCFDLSSCTDPELSRSGKLRES